MRFCNAKRLSAAVRRAGAGFAEGRWAQPVPEEVPWSLDLQNNGAMAHNTKY